jgi:hypothetical protein
VFLLQGTNQIPRTVHRDKRQRPYVSALGPSATHAAAIRRDTNGVANGDVPWVALATLAHDQNPTSTPKCRINNPPMPTEVTTDINTNCELLTPLSIGLNCPVYV